MICSNPLSNPAFPLPPGPAEEIAQAWRATPYKGWFFLILGLWVALFHFLGNSTLGYVNTPSLFGWMNYAYSQSQDDELGRYMPFIVLALCWWKRDELLAVPKTPWTGALVLLAFALLLHLIGFGIQQTRLSVAGFYFGVYAIAGVAWGWRFLRATFFPAFLLVFCIPFGTLAETITFPLRLIATSVTSAISQYGLGVSLIQNGTQIFDPQGTFRYEVAAACGGLRSLTATLALGCVYAFITLERPWKRLVLILAAFPLAVAGNVLRLTFIVVAAEAFGQEAGNWVHDDPYMSLLPYVPAFIGLGAMGSWLREKSPSPEPPAPTGTLTQPA
jgi:exosortase